jgi:hypothetical protein
MGDEVEPGGLEPMYAYPRATVDEFIRASEAEKQRLVAAIEHDEHRASRARAAIGMHHMMVSMLIETQRELDQMRRDAERLAAEIIAAASNGRSDPRHEGNAPGGSASGPLRERFAPTSIDLVAEDEAGLGSAPRVSLSDSVHQVTSVPYETDDNDPETSQYFAFLREALTDDEPLGPRNPVGASE